MNIASAGTVTVNFSGFVDQLPLLSACERISTRRKLLSDQLNRAGTLHLCVSSDTIPDLVTGPARREADMISFSEGDQKKMACAVYVFRRVGTAQTRLRIDVFVKKSLVARALFGLMKKKMARNFQISAANLARYCEELRRTGQT